MKKQFLLIIFGLALTVTTPSFGVDLPGCPAFLKDVLGKLSPSQQLQVAQLLQKNPELAGQAMELAQLLTGVQAGTTKIRDPRLMELLIGVGSKLQDSGKLPEILKAAAEQAKKLGKIPATMPQEKLDAVLVLANTVIDAELSARGLTRASVGIKYEEWKSLAARLTKDVKSVVTEARSKNPKGILFHDKSFVKQFEKETGATFSQNNEIRLLINGPASFEERTRLIDEAKESIHVMSWAFYDDVTGTTFSEKLIKKAKEGVDVRVMVDGQVAMQPEHMQALKKMEENGVKVVRWRSNDPLRRFDGQHRKFIVFDGKEVVGGGMNFGDVYSHLGPETTAKWRDTDIYFKGPAAQESQNLFGKLWNEQKPGDPIKIETTPVKLKSESATGSSAKISIVNHQPGHGENIYRANLLAIEAATKTIDIENAYFILDPATYQALLRAKERGVRVRVLTNSIKSVDEPIVSYPILESVNRLAKQNFEVYVKEGTETLHSKALTVDGIYSWVGSHNFHPRSFRYEGEVTFNVLDSKFAKSVQDMIQSDIDKAIRVKEPIQVPKNLQAEAVGFYLYDQL